MAELPVIKSFVIKSKAMLEAYTEIEAYAIHKQEFILFGQTGTGKEILARYFYQLLKKSYPETRNFISLNCATFSPEILVSELFGHMKGSFTGATKDKPGIFEEANDCVLFLDEIGDMHPDVQPKLLRALDPNIREGKRLGSNKSYTTKNVLVISATDKKKEEINEPLLYRLGFQVNVPSLEQRQEDIFPAASHFICMAFDKRRDKKAIFAKLFGTADEKKTVKTVHEFAKKITEQILPELEIRYWPGNFRNLRIILDYAMIQVTHSSDKDEFTKDYLYHFYHSLDRYSKRKNGHAESSHTPVQVNSANDTIAAGQDEIYLKLKEVLPNVKEAEIKKIGSFLKTFKSHSFSAEDLHSYIGDGSIRTVQGRLTKLIAGKLVSRTGIVRPKYYPVEPVAHINGLVIKNPALFPIPSIPEKKQVKISHDQINAIINSTKTGYGIYLNFDTNTEFGNSFNISLAHALKDRYTICYFSFEDGAPEELVGKMAELVDLEKYFLCQRSEQFPLNMRIAELSGYLHLHFGKGVNKPLLLLNHMECLSDPDAENAVLEIIRYWNALSIIISGKKMSIQNTKLTEFPIPKQPS
jgi:DNA-binding NtrC family response regulator